jgi:curved DNA-binding protein
MKSQKTPYKILGVASGASESEIRKAYRKLARQYHPDVNPGDRTSEERFKEIAGAYEILSDADKRKSYDEFGEDSLRGGFDPEQAREYSQWQDRRERSGRPFQNEYVDLEDLFGGAFGGRAYASARGADIHAMAELQLAQVVNGTEVSIQLPGTSKPTRVRIPAGAETGSTIRLKGRGGPGLGEGPAGDLVIETRVKPHPLVRRNGLDLTLRVPVTLSEAYNGASIDVPTFSGTVKVSVPPGSQNGTKLRLRKKGISRKSKQGDFYVELELRLPEAGDADFAEVLRKSESLHKQPVRSGLQL